MEYKKNQLQLAANLLWPIEELQLQHKALMAAPCFDTSSLHHRCMFTMFDFVTHLCFTVYLIRRQLQSKDKLPLKWNTLSQKAKIL